MSEHAESEMEYQSKTSVEKKLFLQLLVVAVIPIGILILTVATGMYRLEAIIAAVVIQVVGLALGYVFTSGIVRQTESINLTLARINNGDLKARAESITSDELGQSATALNTLCDNTLDLTQSNGEREIIQASIEILKSEMNAIAAGDLTITLEVKDDMTGPIAQSVNHMTEQIRTIVRQAQTAAEQVTNFAGRIRESSTSISHHNDLQANGISDASKQLFEMTKSFQGVASMTQESVEVAVDARQTASKGLQAVSNTVDGMQRIRDHVQSTSKRIKRLGESSQEIGEIVQLISDIADRTSILALNASIQAAMAGDAGQGFAVVAEEIECLAERSTDATKQISKLIRAIQNETSEVIIDMDESTREVVAGSQLAAQAGETLFEIDSVSNQLVELIESSSKSALQQANAAERIANSMAEISISTKDSAEKSREATRSVGRLANMVKQLRGSVSQFKIAETLTMFDYGQPLVESISNDVDHPAVAADRNGGSNQKTGCSGILNDPTSALAGSESTESKTKPKTLVSGSENRLRSEAIPCSSQTMIIDEPSASKGEFDRSGPTENCPPMLDDESKTSDASNSQPRLSSDEGLLSELREVSALHEETKKATGGNDPAQRKQARTIMLDNS